MMRKVFAAAFQAKTPTKGGSRNGEDGKSFAILRQQSDEELALSEAHSKLDVALSFLQKDIGYILLDEPRRPSSALSRGRATGVPALPKGARSVKVPKEDPPSDAEDDEARPSRIIIGPEAAKYAHYQEDLMLVSRFAAILAESSPAAMSKVKHEQLYKTVLQGVRLMHLCDYEYSDVVMVLAHASVYFRSTFAAIGHKMSEHEAAHVCVLLIYLAHSFLLDETCPLRCWQKHIFRKYCTLKVLDAALFRLFKMRGFLLRITEEEQRVALRGLANDSASPGLVLKDRNGRTLVDGIMVNPAA